MIYKNGYKVVYEVAADGERTFYAAKSNEYPTRNEAGEIIDDVVASFEDADFLGKTIYEYKGQFYVSAGRVPAYNEDGTPKDNKIKGFEKLFVEGYEEGAEATTASVEDDEPVVEDGEEPVVEDDEPVVIEDKEDETVEEE